MRYLRCLVVSGVLGVLSAGCAGKDNPYGPKKVPQFHYPDCKNRCTAIRPWQVHDRR